MNIIDNIKENKVKYGVVLLAFILIGFVGTQYMAAYDSSTGVYWIEKTSYEANVGDTISVTGKVWVTEGGTYKLGVMKPNYFFVDNIATKTYGTITTAGYWKWTVNVPVTKSGEYEFFVILPSGGQAMGTESIIVTAPPTDPDPYIPPTDPDPYIPPTDPDPYIPPTDPDPYIPPYVPPVTTGSIYIDATPDGVLTVDGVKRGMTPLKVDNLEQGSHVYIIELNGYNKFVGQIIVNAGTTTNANPYLEKIVVPEPPEEPTVPSEPSDSQTSSIIVYVIIIGLVYMIVTKKVKR